MAAIKSYTDLPQSKKLMEFLPIESADMHYIIMGDDEDPQSMVGLGKYIGILPTIPCWSLAALLDVLPISLNALRDGKWNAMIQRDGEMRYVNKDNPIDACVAMIEKLHELKIL